ncbi:MAG: phage tail sheath family protein [Bacteroidetes bacterium]|nr:MAG: phage tail sheath family protein [Bacteroidota bacterium]
MALRLATPGVYIEEKSAFPNSVVGLPTAIPAFIGYTEKAIRGGKPVSNRAVRVTSLSDFNATFGGALEAKFNIKEAEKGDFDFSVGGKGYVLEQDEKSKFLFYNAIRHFYDNGGATCYVVSVGSYADTVGKNPLQKGVDVLIAEEEPTMLVIPEAVLLDEAECYALQQAMLTHCGGKMKNRFALLDIHGGYVPRTYDEEDVITKFRNGIGVNYLNYGAAYFPWVQTSITQLDELSYKNIGNADVLIELLEAEADANFSEKKAAELKLEIAKISDSTVKASALNPVLTSVSPTLKGILNQIRGQINILPASSAMAGLYTTVDTSRGVWKAPANVSVSSVIAPMVNLTSDDQEDLNVTLSGKSINAIRPFVGEGVLVWGARTLDGNSKDWRYVNVRRTMIFVEQSVKFFAKSYVFEPNDANTWGLIRSSLDSFLTNLWKSGALAGSSPATAFDLAIGLGETMTPDDILEGILRITVRVAISRPAEFIVVTFQQKMQES